MKKYIILIVGLFSILGIGQKSTSKILIEEIEKSKTGNYKDILSSFYQLSTANFTGDTKTIGLNSTLFAIKSNVDPTLLEEENFIRNKVSRNTQLNFKLKLDKDFKYNGFTGGIIYAFLNGRDKKLADFRDTEVQIINSQLNKEINSIIIDFDLKNIDSIHVAILGLMEGKDNNKNIYYSKIRELYKKKYGKEIKQSIDEKNSLIDLEYKKIDAQPLWTISIDGTANKNGKFNQASIGTIFLKGIKDSRCEIDFRSKLSYSDTITSAPTTRLDFNTKLGANFKLGKTNKNVSYFETKFELEYNSILRNLLPTEKKNSFLGNAEIRVRITDDLWLPFIIKYDIENANFLGFLNLSYNFGSFFDSIKK